MFNLEDLFKQIDDQGATLVHLAMRYGQYDLVLFIIKELDFQVEYQTSFAKQTILHEFT